MPTTCRCCGHSGGQRVSIHRSGVAVGYAGGFMRAPLLWRKVHYWLSIVVALPILVVVCTGVLLQVKKDVSWIQPEELRGNGPPAISFEQILATCAELPEIDVQGWEDVDRLDLRPEKSLLKVTTREGWEVQMDPSDGRVLRVAVR